MVFEYFGYVLLWFEVIVWVVWIVVDIVVSDLLLLCVCYVFDVVLCWLEELIEVYWCVVSDVVEVILWLVVE